MRDVRPSIHFAAGLQAVEAVESGPTAREENEDVKVCG
jgi:hypothetical protein